MDLKMRTPFAFMTILVVATEAVRLYPCDSGYRDVEENNAVTFHCDQYSEDVVWSHKGPKGTSFSTISTCNRTQCSSQIAPYWTPTFISAGNSSLTTTLTSRNVRVAGGQYGCGNQTCKLHVIAPASVSKPTSFFTRSDQGKFLHCQTSIMKVYSSKGQYSCVWQNGTTQVNGTLKLQPPPHDTTNTSDRMGTCNVTLQLSNPSDAICNVTVSPGNTYASSGIVAETPKPEFGIVPVIAGSSGGVVVVVVVVVVVIYVIKRNKKGVQKTSSGHSRNGNPTAREDDPDYDIEIVNVCYESAESTIGQVPGSHYEYIDTRLSMNPTPPVAAYAQSSNYAEKENITDEYACVRRDK